MSESATYEPKGKAGTLLELRSAGFNVPELFIAPEDTNELLNKAAAIGWPLCVRSSASCEDGSRASFAGQFESFLNIESDADLITSVSKCRDSINSNRVREYCTRHGIDSDVIKIEVIVQRMVEAEFSGVAFSVNPATGEDCPTIEMVEGLGDRLLEGSQSPLDISSQPVQKYRPAIEQLCRRLQVYFGVPQDVEFAIAEDRLFLVQSRPITRIQFGDTQGQWTNADFRDGGVSSSVCSPMMWSLYDLVWDATLKSNLKRLKLWPGDFDAGRMFCGRPYWNLGAVKKGVSKIPGYIEREFDDDLSVEVAYDGPGETTPTRVRTVMRAIPVVFALRKFFREQTAAAELALEQYRDFEFAELAKEVVQREVRFDEVVRGSFFELESSYFSTIYAVSLAKLDFVEAFPELNYVEIVSRLPALSHMAPLRAFQAAQGSQLPFDTAWLSEFRHHCRWGIDVIHPRWDEESRFVAELYQETRRDGTRATDKVPSAEELAQQFDIRLKQRKRFCAKASRLRHLVWLREELRDCSLKMYWALRKMILAEGDRTGLGEEIFFASFDEVDSPDQRKLAERKDVYLGYRNFEAPNEIGLRFKHQGTRGENGLSGITASLGCIQGRAFVARNVGEAMEAKPNDILVCPCTDPGWTPILDRIAGVVTETGGQLSHAAVICREFDIPALLSVPGATDRIPHRHQIELNATEGRVSLL